MTSLHPRTNLAIPLKLPRIVYPLDFLSDMLPMFHHIKEYFDFTFPNSSNERVGSFSTRKLKQPASSENLNPLTRPSSINLIESWLLNVWPSSTMFQEYIELILIKSRKSFLQLSIIRPFLVTKCFIISRLWTKDITNSTIFLSLQMKQCLKLQVQKAFK